MSIIDIFPPWWDFVMVGICWVTMMMMMMMMMITTIFLTMVFKRRIVDDLIAAVFHS